MLEPCDILRTLSVLWSSCLFVVEGPGKVPIVIWTVCFSSERVERRQVNQGEGLHQTAVLALDDIAMAPRILSRWPLDIVLYPIVRQ